jgi:hypothetical protein
MTDRIKIEVRREGAPADPFDEGKFSEKMTHEQRCFALCLYIRGEPWRRIAAYFNAHYRTVQMIKTGPRYKPVRSEFQQLGQEGFMAKYETEIAVAEYAKWKKDHDEDFGADKQHTDHTKPGWNPIKTATAQRGQHQRISTVDGSTVFFEVQWRDSNDGMKPGWYVFDVQGTDGPYGTSALAFDASKRTWSPEATVAAPDVDDEQVKATELFENAKHARAEMELHPSEETVIKFIEAAFAVYAFVDKSEGLPEPSAAEMFERIDWKGFDWTPYYKKLY